MAARDQLVADLQGWVAAASLGVRSFLLPSNVLWGLRGHRPCCCTWGVPGIQSHGPLVVESG